MKDLLSRKLLLIFLALFLISPLAKSIQATDISSSDMIGLRGGVWKVEEARDLPPTIDAKTYTPYLELFISYGLKKGFSLELDLGAGYRGDTKLLYEDVYYWENWNLYPISAKIKYSFLSFYSSNDFQPYLDLGLTFLTSTSTYNDPYYLDIVHVRTKSTLGALAGWGMDLNLSSRILLNLDFQYRWVSFNQEIAGIKNYSGPQLTFGLEYIIKHK